MNPEIDPFGDVRIGQNKRKQSENKNDAFENVRLKKAEGFPFLYEGGRHITRTASRIAETIGGIPGDISDLIQSGIFAGLEKLVGEEATPEVRKKSSQNRLPTTSELRETTKKLSKGFTEPKSEEERKIDEYTETVASLFGPMKFRKALGVALTGSLAKEGLELIGTKKNTQELGKLGTIFLSTLYNPKGSLKYSDKQYEIANALSKGASIDAHHFQGHLINMLNDLKKGVSTPGKDAVIKPTQQLIDKVKGGKILVQDLTSAKRDISSLIGDFKTVKGERKLLKKLGKEVDLAIKPYERINPPFSKAYRPANEIHGAVKEGNKASNFIKRTLGTKSVLGAIAGEAILGHPELILPTVGTATGVMGTAKIIDFVTRLKKSPKLREYYIKAMIAAAKEDVGALKYYDNKLKKD